MFDRSRFSRRRLLQLSGSVGIAVVATGHSGYATAQVGTPIVATGEAPMLAEQVAAGALPALAERLPTNPMVVRPHEEIGTYGGQWRTALVGGDDTSWLDRTSGYDGLVRWDLEWNEPIPNVAESYEISDDALSYTFTLRRGMKWSDGAPFTSADIEFYVNDFYRDPDLNTGLGPNPFTIEVVDDVTFIITYEQPNGFALGEMAQDAGQEWVRYPRHYLEQFH
ncbi:MAG: ABC transporter substrate-binding protein [Thermomicrobiales bacterium]